MACTCLKYGLRSTCTYLPTAQSHKEASGGNSEISLIMACTLMLALKYVKETFTRIKWLNCVWKRTYSSTKGRYS